MIYSYQKKTTMIWPGREIWIIKGGFVLAVSNRPCSEKSATLWLAGDSSLRFHQLGGDACQCASLPMTREECLSEKKLIYVQYGRRMSSTKAAFRTSRKGSRMLQQFRNQTAGFIRRCYGTCLFLYFFYSYDVPTEHEHPSNVFWLSYNSVTSFNGR
jgi:hypothetical protein